jgi:signal transduction histidine kinase
VIGVDATALASCEWFMATLPRSVHAPRCDIHAIAVTLAEELSARHGTSFRVEGEGVMNGVWSASSLRTILEQLLGNAVLHGDARAAVTTRIRRREGRLLLSVHNEGVELSSVQQALLFEPLGSVRASTWLGKRRGGLALMRDLVEALGGVVTMRSAPSGTTFDVDLPIDGRAS